ncbi:MAG TPA: 23S rRNA (pseudouridine(1915)-N(3))-methyltransferase RlmH [Gemmatimonadaceae bacterium]|jgi:23S rRNA (pseudouridine1915-N3)-methyltransferase|nr:23S rRNA (pseudouridine(1915)-N(3))-methyltransferase RlmH [Gemmatimonadaceae bacterium]
MHFLVAAVGKPRDANLAGAIAEYETRAARYWPLRVQEVREEPARSSSPDLVREREGERLLHVLPPGAQVVACDVNGRAMASEQFARWLQDLRERAVDVGFVIGGAFGLGGEVTARASASLALAPWTLPHELARLVLAEQLYRAGTIVRREPYHK